MTIGQNIKRFRQNLGWTQLELANKVGVHVSAVGSWETDSFTPRVPILIELTKIFDVDMNTLFDMKPKEYIEKDKRMNKEAALNFVLVHLGLTVNQSFRFVNMPTFDYFRINDIGELEKMHEYKNKENEWIVDWRETYGFTVFELFDYTIKKENIDK